MPSVWRDNTQALEEQHMQRALESQTISQPVPYTFTRYDFTLDMRGTPQFTGEIEITNRSDAALSEIVLMLYHQLRVIEFGESFRRDGNFVWAILPEPLAPGDSMNVPSRRMICGWRSVMAKIRLNHVPPPKGLRRLRCYPVGRRI